MIEPPAEVVQEFESALEAEAKEWAEKLTQEYSQAADSTHADDAR